MESCQSSASKNLEGILKRSTRRS